MKKNRVLRLISMSCLALSLALISCGKNSLVIKLDDQARIYAAVIKRLYQDFGDGQRGPQTVYIMKSTDDSGGVPQVEANTMVLPELLQQAVISELTDTKRIYVWVSQASEIPIDDVFAGGSCQVILGNIHLQKDNSVQVTASLYYGGTGGGGTTFIVEMINDTWTVTGTTGSIWMS